MIFISRAQCGLALPDPNRLATRQDHVVGATVHHTATPAPINPGESLVIWRAIQTAAMSGNNVNHTQFGDIEYNAGVDDFGQLLEGRDNRWVGAHATSRDNLANRITFGVAYIGTGNPSALAFQTLREYFFVASVTIGHGALKWNHSDWVTFGGIATDCPGPALRTWHP